MTKVSFMESFEFETPKNSFIEFVKPSFKHMEEFQSHTLVRLLLSFIPLVDLLHRYKVKPENIYSFGSGSCSHEAYLKDIYPSSVIKCYDLSKKYIPEYTREKIDSDPKFSFSEIDFDEFDWLPFKNVADFVFSIQTLEHIEDHELALENLMSVCKKSGYIYIDTPFYSENDEQEEAEYLSKEKERQWEKHSHYHLGFSLRETERRLNDNGFKVLYKGFSCYKDGENELLNLIRRLALYKRKKSSNSYINGLVGLFHSILTISESEAIKEMEVLDSIKHRNRKAFAIRVLAQKH